MSASPGRILSFDAVAPLYDQTRALPPELADDVARLCASAAHLPRGGLFLDAGVGTGRLAAPLSRLHPGQIVGADLSLPMLRLAREKTVLSPPSLVQADLLRLPFRRGVFQGALLVHVLHLIERWPLVVQELRRVLVPKTGVLIIGTELGNKSLIVERYYAHARGRGVMPLRPRVPGLTRILAMLRAGGARVEPLSAPYLAWMRRATVSRTLEALACRAYSQMWDVPDDAHQSLMADAAEFAARVLGGPETVEPLPARFALYTLRWP